MTEDNAHISCMCLGYVRYDFFYNALTVIQPSIELDHAHDLAALKEGTQFVFLNASANPGIAKLLDTDWFRSTLGSAQGLPAAEPEDKMAFDS